MELTVTMNKNLGYSIPVDADLTPLAAVGIQQGIALCKNYFKAEIAATIKFVKETWLNTKRISNISKLNRVKEGSIDPSFTFSLTCN